MKPKETELTKSAEHNDLGNRWETPAAKRAQARRERRDRIVRQVRAGLTLEQIAAVEGVSRQRISTIVGRSVYTIRPHVGPKELIGPAGRISRTLRRFWARVRVDESECWIWTGSINVQTGYGWAHIPGAPRGDKQSNYAHRIVYEFIVGPIPDGLTIDHLCRVRACVNPAHLEPVTHRENILRSPIAPAAINARKTHCKRGHPFDEANTIIEVREGRRGRRCRECALAKMRVYDSKRRGAA